MAWPRRPTTAGPRLWPGAGRDRPALPHGGLRPARLLPRLLFSPGPGSQILAHLSEPSLRSPSELPWAVGHPAGCLPGPRGCDHQEGGCPPPPGPAGHSRTQQGAAGGGGRGPAQRQASGGPGPAAAAKCLHPSLGRLVHSCAPPSTHLLCRWLGALCAPGSPRLLTAAPPAAPADEWQLASWQATPVDPSAGAWSRTLRCTTGEGAPPPWGARGCPLPGPGMDPTSVPGARSVTEALALRHPWKSVRRRPLRGSSPSTVCPFTRDLYGHLRSQSLCNRPPWPRHTRPRGGLAQLPPQASGPAPARGGV